MNILAAISFMAFPCAPPRAMKDEGYIDTLYSISHADVYTSTRRFVNPYAAMPSMHQGYSLLFSLTIVIMLRSEILASRTESDDDDSDAGLVSEKTADSRFATVRAYFAEIMRRYNRYHLLSSETRQSERKLFLISLLPIVLLAYPIFMFVVIVGTGNHFVLDAIAGAGAFALACLFFPFVARALVWIECHVIRRAFVAMTKFSERIIGAKTRDIEMGDVKEGEMSEEKKRVFGGIVPTCGNSVKILCEYVILSFTFIVIYIPIKIKKKKKKKGFWRHSTQLRKKRKNFLLIYNFILYVS